MRKELPRLWVYSDGAARGNPGPAAIGYAIYDASGQLLEQDAACAGELTNNEAEYEALLWAMDRVAALCPEEARFHMDSELVVRQMTGRYAVDAPNLRSLHERAKAEMKRFPHFTISHVPRTDDRIRRVDELVNAALDEKGF